MSLVAGLLLPRLFSSKLSKLKAAEKFSGSATQRSIRIMPEWPKVTETQTYKGGVCKEKYPYHYYPSTWLPTEASRGEGKRGLNR
jgi:hypothetical protein